MSNKYNPIGDYAIVGNCKTTALIHKEGSIDFYCFPRFDSPSVFAKLLDANKGGSFNVRPQLKQFTTSQQYLLNTNVLLTRYRSEKDTIDIFDFMPLSNGHSANQLIRVVKVIRGDVTFDLEMQMAPDYARDDFELVKVSAERVQLSCKSLKEQSFEIASNIPLYGKNNELIKEFSLASGSVAVFTIGEQANQQDSTSEALKAYALSAIDDTVDYWRSWISKCSYQGDHAAQVNRSALTLKLLTSRDFGSTVAAATFSLPEKIGASRNYDYRFTWVRDAAFTMYAFMRLGFYEESQCFMSWIQDRIENDLSKDVELQIMYKIDGSKDLEEKEIDLSGYKNSAPVRIGNAATDQVQLDIFGELMDTIYLFDKFGEPISYSFWQRLEKLLDFVCKNWDMPDHGIWEVRETKRDYLYTRVMCWVALDRAVSLVKKRSFPTNIEKWVKNRNLIYNDIQENFWNEELQSFVHFKGAKTVDCAMLIMPLVHAISPFDKKWISTMKLINEQLVSDVLVYRNMHDTIPKEEKEEATFLIGAFWQVEAMARGGDVAKASHYLEKLLMYGNHVDLFAEEMTLSGSHLGNFPQAFTHLGLISAVLNLDKCKNAQNKTRSKRYNWF